MLAGRLIKMVEIELVINKFVWKDKRQNYSTEETILFKGGRFELESEDESIELTDEYIKLRAQTGAEF